MAKIASRENSVRKQTKRGFYESYNIVLFYGSSLSVLFHFYL